MLSLSNVGTGAVAAEYYEVVDDYYTADCSPSDWWGKGAVVLGLVGPVDSVVFADLLDGKMPDGSLIHNAAEGRRGGTDGTFSAPKSISLQALVGGDCRLLEAHQHAVNSALAYAESLAACRVTESGETRSQHTGNLIVAKFEHDLSRACDPQLHTHCVIINATQRSDGQWRAMDNETLYRHKMLLGAMYRSELAREVQMLGYEVRATHLDGRFELAHIHDHQIMAFSQRSASIEAYLKDNGQERSVAGAWFKKLAAVVTREKKSSVDRALLWHEWTTLSREKCINYAFPEAHELPAVANDAVQAVLHAAVAHLAERESVFGRAELLRVALERGVGVATLAELETALDAGVAGSELIQRGDRYTTLAAQQREAKILDIEVAGRNALVPIHVGDRAELHTRLAGLTIEQQQAALGVLLTGHQVLGIQGRAGVGKTTLLEKTAVIVTSSGYKVQGLAPSASAARELAETGMAAETIATFSQRKHKGLTPKTLLIVDEAGMVSTKQLHDVLTAAKEAHCRVLLVGDTAQLNAVEAGKPFVQLQANGMATALVSQIQRQRNPFLKQAVEHAVNGQVSLAAELLDKDITQIKAAAERFDQIANDYVTLSPAERDQTRVIAGTRFARAEINRRIRDRLQFGGEDYGVTMLTRKDLTESGRRSTLGYEIGDVVQAEVDYPSLRLKRGEFAQVVDRLNHRIVLKCEDGAQVAWQPSTMTRLTAFVPQRQPLASGDLIRVTANDRARGLVNGDLAKVVAIYPDTNRLTLELSDGRQVSLDSSQPLTMDYGYCSTVYSAQGQTCDRVLVEADAHSLTSNQKSFYVAISRARQAAKIYTDDREMLPIAMSREYEKSSALELSPVGHERGLEAEV
ncbi:MobF family relaxase [Methylovorus mays]|uniref:MobF family relaxase n=1 Tax=Methylovorus mays TaxID=184077 RepID=UPI001E33C91B|nr:MobF family relaxase [Methylovorus mays]MCB5207709.1 conjugative relaxase [Methylovorus mays]